MILVTFKLLNQLCGFMDVLNYIHSPYIHLHAVNHNLLELFDGVIAMSEWRSWQFGRSSPSWVKVTKSLQQAPNFKVAGFFGSRPKLAGFVYHNNIVGT